MPATKNDLLDRYLHAVKFWLPKPQQRDILAEIAEDLHSQVEEREAALGHELSADELVAILKKRGSPLGVASGYLPEQRLINPAMLPVYRLVLKIALLWVLAPLFAIVFIGPLFTSAHPERVMLLAWAQAWQTGFMVVGMVTVVFVLLDRYGGKIRGLDNWDPRKLPRVPVTHETSARWNHLAGFIFGTLAAICWVWLMWQRTGFLVPGGVRIILGPVWKYTYWPVLGLTLVSASIDLAAFLYPCWWRVRSRVRIGVDASMLVVVAAVLRAGNWVEIAASNLPAAEVAKGMTVINGAIEVTLIMSAVITAGDAIVEIRRLLGAKAASTAPIMTTW